MMCDRIKVKINQIGGVDHRCMCFKLGVKYMSSFSLDVEMSRPLYWVRELWEINVCSLKVCVV